LSQFFIQCIVTDHEEIFIKFLHYFVQGKLINLAIRYQPADLHPDLLKHALPIDHLLKFILRIMLFLQISKSGLERGLAHVVELGNDV